jgi:glycosyltransferase involved in cell wall biosynthesis
MEATTEIISVLIPCYNEEGNIKPLYDKVSASLSSHPFEIIFIDDGSTDSTLKSIKELFDIHKNVRYLSFARNFGHQNAIKAGIDYASGNCLIMMDADLQHPPELMPKMIEKWKEGFDIVYTVRTDINSKKNFKKITSRLFYKIINLLSDIKVEEGTADYRLIDRKVIDVFKYDINEYFLFFRGLISWIGFKQFAIEYESNDRFSGKSKYSVLKMIRFALNGITSLGMQPLRFATFLGLFVSGCSFIYALYALYIDIIKKTAMHGWTSTILIIAFIGGIQMILLGIIGEYLGKLFFEVKKRPHYILKDTNIVNKEKVKKQI